MNQNLYTTTKLAQSNGHYIMTDGIKPLQKKIIHFNTKYADEFDPNNYAKYTITIPDNLNNIKTLHLESVEIPNSVYNFATTICDTSNTISNTYFHIQPHGSSTITKIKIQDGNYTTISQLLTAINQAFTDASISGIQLTNTTPANKIKIANTSGITYLFHFALNENGQFDKYNFKNKLGWLLGFRTTSITLPTSQNVVATSVFNIAPTKELYFALDEKAQNTTNSTQVFFANNSLAKNILAKIQYDFSSSTSTNYIFATKENGRLITTPKIYNTSTNFKKINVAIIDENGNYVNLNGLDFSFSISIEFH
ncbi:MAG: hypothetical protein EBS86_14855 [Crocinitomicaceae bacterium]|nr:hypothetical protein [Crocinitomicaceae bacterium]